MEKKSPIILIIDDDLDFKEVVSVKLKSVGYSVFTADNGEEGLAKIKENKPDLLLLDIEMPVMNGVEMFLKMKSEPEIANLKTIFLTNYGDPQKESSWLDEKFAHEVGALEYIKKSEDLDKIVAMVGGVLGKV